MAIATDHWNCLIDHPPQRGFRVGRMHRVGCEVSDGHDADRPPFRCKVCARRYSPPLTERRVFTIERHYACALSRYEHTPSVPPSSKTGHNSDCATRGIHRGSPGHKCPGCTKLYRGQPDDEPTLGRSPSHPHWACSIPWESHTRALGKGYGHRSGCAVAEGHRVGSVHGCPACRKTLYQASTRPSTLRRKFQMTSIEYAELLEKQDGKCAICKEPPPDGRTLAVDHSHVTGRNRGLLCFRCNLGLGYFRDREDVLLNARKYLRGQAKA